ncbi:bcl-2-related protein A1 isoform X2 [Rhinolophus sinicus]|uniref:bcl-2-related protein A1 isoform X2 n=1 Tax=Rhinolophus sinicus TaxID=89399 RepID=UPI003D7AAC60
MTGHSAPPSVTGTLEPPSEKYGLLRPCAGETPQEDADARRGPAEAQAWSELSGPSAEPCLRLSCEKTCDYRFKPLSVGLGAGKQQVPSTDVWAWPSAHSEAVRLEGPSAVTVAAAMQPTARHRWQKLFVRGRVILLLFLMTETARFLSLVRTPRFSVGTSGQNKTENTLVRPQVLVRCGQTGSRRPCGPSVQHRACHTGPLAVQSPKEKTAREEAVPGDVSVEMPMREAGEGGGRGREGGQTTAQAELVTVERRKTFELLPPFGCCTECCCEHSRFSIHWSPCFLFFGYVHLEVEMPGHLVVLYLIF